VVLIITVGCSSTGNSAATNAETVFRQRMQENPEFAAYAFSVGGNSQAPRVRAVVLESLDSEDYAMVLGAVKALGDPPPENARESLRRAFAEGKGALKLNAGIALARMGDEQALKWVREAVKDAGAMLNAEMAVLPAQRGEAELIAPIIRQRMDSDGLAQRNAAYGMLAEIDEPWAVTLLQEGLRNEHGENRVEAILALGRAGDPAAAAAIEDLAKYQGLVLASIETLGTLGNPSSVTVVREMSGHDVALVRAYAGAALWKLGEPETAQGVLEPLRSGENPTVRRNVAEQLEALAEPPATAWLLELSRDADASVRLAAVRGLAGRDGPEVAERLVEAASDPDYEVATLALRGLASVGSVEDVPRIEPLLENENPYIAISAANAILSILPE
jgi:HEAT repeat protein